MQARLLALLVSILLALGTSIFMMKLLAYDQGEVAAAQRNRHRAALLADQLRQSSDDLTRMARTYVATKNSKYRDTFYAILDIRDGKRTRPDNYQSLWEVEQLPSGTEGIALLDMIAELGLSEQEARLLALAKRNSDDLAVLERTAFRMLEDSGNANDELDIARGSGQRDAIELLNGSKYHALKQAVMSPISEFARLIDERTQREIMQATDKDKQYLQVIALLIAITIFTIFLAVAYIRKGILNPIRELEDLAHRVEEGQHGKRVKISGTGEIATLDRAFNQMLAHTEEAILDIEKARMHAEQANTAKSEFLANMSHEIRTPMNGIMGMTQLLNLTETTEQQQEYLDVINRSGLTLMTVIDDILDYSKIEAGKLSLESTPFNLHDLIHNISTPYQLQSDSSIEMEYEIAENTPEFVIGDPTRLHQVLNNLLNNAFKFTHQGQVKLSIESSGLEGNIASIQFCVSDTGVGIEKDIQEYLFDAFTQADQSVNRKFGGTGLGLAICKKIINLMGGDIHVESTPGKGSRFTFSVPLSMDKQDKRLENNQIDLKKFTRIRTLLVEDNSINQLVAQAMIGKLGAPLTVASSGEEALEYFYQQDFELVLMDCEMPGLDGYMTTRKIRQWEKTHNKKPTPVFALSANALSEQVNRSFEAGMDEHLTKPISLEQLQKTYEKICTEYS
jgi:two-component system, NarL family, sensor histidine kinase BarA